MSKIEIKNVYKIFGNNPQSIMPMVRDGATKEDVLEQTGHTVGLDNVSINIVGDGARLKHLKKRVDIENIEGQLITIELTKALPNEKNAIESEIAEVSVVAGIK